MKKHLIALLSFLVMTLGLIFTAPMSATADDAFANDIDYDTEGLCFVSPERTEIVEYDGYNLRERRWQKQIPAVDEVTETLRRFYRDIPAIDEVTKTLHTFYRDIPAIEETFSNWYRWKTVTPTTVDEYRYKKIIPGTDGLKECKYKKWIDGSPKVMEYRWEAVFKKGKELKGVEVTSSRQCSKGDSGTYYLMPENVQPERFDGIAPKGNVNLSVYCNSYKDGLKGSDSVAYRYGETYKVYYPGPGADSWTENGSTPSSPSGSSWGYRIERVKTPATDGHWEYEWFTSDPGGKWVKTDDCRWKEEPKPETVKWFPSEDGWTTETKDNPWVLDDTRTVAGPDDISWFPSEDGWTQEIKDAPWIKDDEESRGNDDGVPGYREFKTTDGTTLVEDEASEFEESSFEGWTLLASRTEVVSEGVDGYREYLTGAGEGSTDISDAAWLTDESVEGWGVLDSRMDVIVEAADAYWVYYLSGGEPTLELGEDNWTSDDVDRSVWEFIDKRDRWVDEPWSEEVLIDAVWEECDDKEKTPPAEELAFTGAGDYAGWMIGGAIFMVALGGLGITASRKGA